MLDINYFPTPEAYLAHGRGEVVPWEGVEMSDVLRYPLVKTNPHDDWFIMGKESGDRSVVFEYDRKMYKLKGCVPTSRKHEAGEPWGGMSETKCLRELQVSEKISNAYAERGLDYPLKPVGRFVYDQKFEDGNVNCGIFEILGDTRLGRVSNRSFINPPHVEPHVFERYVSIQAQWLGFDQSILDECNISYSPRVLDTNNFVVYPVGSGFGVSRIDHASSQDGKRNTSRKIQDDIATLEGLAERYVWYGTAYDLGLFEKLPRRFITRGRTDHDIAIAPKYVDTYDEEGFVADNSGLTMNFGGLSHLNAGQEITMKIGFILSICKERYDFAKGLKKTYNAARKSGDVPEPIDRFAVEQIVSMPGPNDSSFVHQKVMEMQKLEES